MQAERPVEEHVYKGTMDCLKKIAAGEGISAGISKDLLRMLSGAGLLLSCWFCMTGHTNSLVWGIN